MTKRAFSIVLAFLICICTVATPAFAAEPVTSTENITYYEDGSYIVTVMSQSTARATGTTQEIKTSTYYDANDVAQWRLQLKASFYYDGTTSTCTGASTTVDIYDDNWYVISRNTEKSGNVATSTATFGKKVLGITIQKVPITITITCDKDGNRS